MAKKWTVNCFVALFGSALTLVQIILLLLRNEGICFNDGCEIVDSLTIVPPIILNIAGFFFFQIVFWAGCFPGEKKGGVHFLQIVLLAGLAAEAVLFTFQYKVAEVFCSYCLVVLALVLLLNILAGFRHMIMAGSVFFAVIAALMSLQLSGGNSKNLFENLDSGTLAIMSGEENGVKKYLFFSSSCTHCEKIIETLKEGERCAVRFNPIDTIDHFPLDDVEKRKDYSTQQNKEFLGRLGLQQVPVLVTVSPSVFNVFSGEYAISGYLKENCQIITNEDVNDGQSSTISGQYGNPGESGLDFLPPADDGCSVQSDCDEQQLKM